MADEGAHGEARASDDGALQTTSKDVDELYESDAVYTTGQMLELHGKTATSRHFSGRSAYLPRVTARSASRLQHQQIGTEHVLRRGDQETSWQRIHRNCHINFR